MHIRIHDEEKGYYADGEDAYDMRKYFKKPEDNNKATTAENSGRNDEKKSIAGEREVTADMAKLNLKETEEIAEENGKVEETEERGGEEK